MGREFACDALPCPLVGKLERNSIEFNGDRLLGALGIVRCKMQRPF